MAAAIPTDPVPVEHLIREFPGGPFPGRPFLVEPFLVDPFPAGAFSPRAPAPGCWSLVTAHGDLDVATAPALDQALHEAVTDDQPTRHLVLDLGAVTFLDCSGLRPLLRARSRLADRFWLANIPPQPRRLLGLAGLDRVFSILDDLPPVTPIPRRRAGGTPPEAGTP